MSTLQTVETNEGSKIRLSLVSQASSEDLERYTEGECHVFAVALSRLTGWQIFLVLDEDEPYWASEDGEEVIPSVLHAFCRDHEGNAWDIRGMRPGELVREEMEALYAPNGYGIDTLYSEDELAQYCGYWSDEGEPIDRPLHEIMASDLEEATLDILRVFEGCNLPCLENVNEPESVAP